MVAPCRGQSFMVDERREGTRLEPGPYGAGCRSLPEPAPRKQPQRRPDCRDAQRMATGRWALVEVGRMKILPRCGEALTSRLVTASCCW